MRPWRLPKWQYKEILRKLAESGARRARRLEKRKALRAVLPIRKTRKDLRAQLDAVWALCVKTRDNLLYGPMCRVCGRFLGPLGLPAVAYHIVPKQRGDAIRWGLENGVLACSPCNNGEVNNRSLYRDKHVRLFGKELVEGIEAKARAGAKYSLPDLVAKLEDLKARLGSGRWGTD